MPARLVQVNLINNSKLTMRWADDGRSSGDWQEPWLPSNIKSLSPGQQAAWRLESAGLPLTGAEGWVLFAIDVPHAPDQKELLRLWWDRPYVGTFTKGYEQTPPVPFGNDSRNQLPSKISVIDHQYHSLGTDENIFSQFSESNVLVPFTNAGVLAQDETANHVVWTVEVRPGAEVSTLPLKVSAPGILWYNSATGETQIWEMNDRRIVRRATVLGENGSATFIGPPFSIVGAGDMNGDGKSDILWHNSATGETQIWEMNGHKVASRATVLAENGSGILVGLPWSIVGVADMNGDGKADIVWHNSATNETQIWFMNNQKIASRATVIGESAAAALVGPPFSIVGAGDMNGDGKYDILWHNSTTGETQIWEMDGHKLASRATVLAENGSGILVGLPWSIVGVADMNGDGKADIVWHNSATGETQIWFMNNQKIARRATVIGENGSATFIGPPWNIVGAGSFPSP